MRQPRSGFSPRGWPTPKEEGSEFLPLIEAGVIVYREATGRATSDAEILTKVAGSIAKHAPLYARESWGSELRAIRDEVMAGAVFYQGGEMMRSRNVTYTGLCIRGSDLAEVIELVARLYRAQA